MKKLVIAGCGLALFACVKDKPLPGNDPVLVTTSGRVYILNEGNFGRGNSTVSVYDPVSGGLQEDIYSDVNAEKAGDVIQSMERINSRYYVVVNNSGKIIECDNRFRKTAEIKGMSSPRYILPVTNSKAYVSDFRANGIHVLDLAAKNVSSTIPCAGWTEQMAKIHHEVFVCNKRRDYLYVINTITDQVSDSVFVSANATGICIDKYDRIWVLTEGDSAKSVKPRLCRINPVSHQVEWHADLNSYAYTRQLAISPTLDTLYYLCNGICRTPVNNPLFVSQPFIPQQNKNFYALNVDPTSGLLYVSDAHDYLQRSSVYVYGGNGDQVTTFKAGLVTNGFYFE